MPVTPPRIEYDEDHFTSTNERKLFDLVVLTNIQLHAQLLMVVGSKHRTMDVIQRMAVERTVQTIESIWPELRLRIVG